MKLSPHEVGRLSFAQWIALTEGWRQAHERANAPDPNRAPSDADYYRLIKKKPS